MMSQRIVSLVSLVFLSSCLEGGEDPEIGDQAFAAESDLAALGFLSQEAEESVFAISNAPSFSALSRADLFVSDVTLFSDSPLLLPGGTCPSVSVTDENSLKTITRTFDGCQRNNRLAGRARPVFSGETVIAIDYSSESVDGVLDRDITVTRELVITLASEATLHIDAENTHGITGTFPNLTHDVTLDIDRTLRSRGGIPLRRYEITGDLTYTSSGDGGELNEIEVDGTLGIYHRLRSRRVDYTFADIVWNEDCCHPVSGSIQRVLSNSEEVLSEVELTFDGTCGEMLRDGVEVELDDCE